MDIVFRHVRHVKIIHIPHTRNINAARRYICGHQHIHLAIAKLGQGAVALALAFVAMNGPGLKAPGYQQLHQLFRAMLGAAKDQRLLARMLVQIVLQHTGFVAAWQIMHALNDPLNRLAGRGNLHFDRVLQIG